MKILGISGSLRPASLNTSLVRAAAHLAPPDSDFTVYAGMGDLPHFSPELDTDTPLPAVADLRAQLAAADIVLICTPEYAHGMPGSLKNLLDWTVSSGDFDAKPTIALSASPSADGGSYAHAWLLQILAVLGAKTIAAFPIPFARAKLDPTLTRITDPTLAETLRTTLLALPAETL